MSLKLNSAGGGSITLDEPSTASTLTLTLPAVTDTLVGLTATQTLTNKTLTSPAINSATIATSTITDPTITGALVSSMASSILTRDTVNAGGTAPFPASAGPTQVNYTGIPSWVKRITVMLSGVSGSITSNFLIQIGSGSIQNTGYVSTASAGASAATSTIGFILTQTVTAATTQSGIVSIVNFNGNTWVMSSNLSFSNASTTNVGGGTVTLSGTLDRLRFTTVNGTDLFDAGSINIMYE